MIGNVIDSRFFRVVDYPTAVGPFGDAHGRHPACWSGWYVRRVGDGGPAVSSACRSAALAAARLRRARLRLPADADRLHVRVLASTTRASPTSSGRGSRSTTGRTPAARPRCASRWSTACRSACWRRWSRRCSARMIALALVRYRFRFRSSTNLLLFLPMATPEVVLGAALLAQFLNLRVNPGFATIVVAHVMFCISFVVVTVKARVAAWTPGWRRRRPTCTPRRRRRSGASRSRCCCRASPRPRCWRSR